MLIYDYKVSSNTGKTFPCVYYVFSSGKEIRLTLPFPVIRGLIRKGIVKERG